MSLHFKTTDPWAHQPVVTNMKAGEAVLFLWTDRRVRRHLGNEPALSLLLQAHLGCICSVNRGLWEQKDSQTRLAFSKCIRFSLWIPESSSEGLSERTNGNNIFFTDGRKSELDRSHPLYMLYLFLPVESQPCFKQILCLYCVCVVGEASLLRKRKTPLSHQIKYLSSLTLPGCFGAKVWGSK